MKVKLDILNKLEELNEIPNINRGGCAIVAYAMHKYIKQTHSIKPKIVFFHNRFYGWEDNERLNNNQPASCAHAVLQIGNEYYDTKGIKDVSEYSFRNEVNSKLVLKSINEANNWNKAFDRFECVPMISEILNVNLRKVSCQ